MFARTLLAIAFACASVGAMATTVTTAPIAVDPQNESYVAPPSSAKQTHILSVYWGGKFSEGDNSVHIHVNGKTSKPVTLVVSAYEATTFVFDGKGRASVGTVIVNGFNHHKLVGLPFYTKVIKRTGFNTRTGQENYLSACAVEWPNDTRGCDTPSLVKGVEALTKTPISSFTADDYDLTDFTVNLSN